MNEAETATISQQSRHTRAMEPPTLLTLPAEIRNIIFGMILVNCSGRVTLHRGEPKNPGQCASLKVRTLEESQPGDPEHVTNEISLAFLGACKQIHMDCKDLLWTRHTFVFRDMDLLRVNSHQASFFQLPYRHIRHLEVNSDLLVGFMGLIMELLAKWVLQGAALRTFTVKVFLSRRPRNLPYLSGSMVLHQLKVMGQLLEINTANSEGCKLALQKLDRKLFITTKLEDYLRPVYRGGVDFEKVVQEMHQAFGGELWIGEKLCWKDGEQVARGPTQRSIGA